MLAKYGLIQLLGKFFPGVIGFIVAGALTRLLSPDEYGIYGLAMALAQFVALGAFGWLGLSVVRMAASGPRDRGFESSVRALFGIITAAATSGGMVLYFILAGESYAPIIAAGVLGSIVVASLDLKSSFHTADFDFVAVLAINVVRAAAGAVVAVTVAYLGGTGLSVFLGSSVAMLAACLVSRQRFARRSFVPDLTIIRRICAFGIPIAGSLALFAVSAWTDRLVLSLYSGPAAVGFYTAGMIIVQNTLQWTAQAIGSAAYPLAVVAYENGGRLASDRQLEQNFVALLCFLLPGAIGFCMLAPNIAEVLVGRDYRDAVIALTPLLAAASVISGFRGNFVDHCFQLTGKTWHYMSIAVVTTVINLAALLTLVPHYGYMGAGFASLATGVAGLVYALIASRHVYRIPFPVREIAKVVIAASIMALALCFVDGLRGGAALCLQIGIGAATYIGASLTLNLLNLREPAASLLARWITAR
jgi:O-antigen/teichoic acid export membrane protein